MSRAVWEDDTMDLPAILDEPIGFWDRAAILFIVVAFAAALVTGCYPRDAAAARPVVTGITVKHRPANSHQREMVTRVLHVGRRMGASRKVNIAAIETITVESKAQNLPYGHLDSLGLFQQRPSMGWGTPQQVMNPEHAARQFYLRAIRLDKKWPGLLTGELAQMVQASAHPSRYQLWAGEARHTYIRYLTLVG